MAGVLGEAVVDRTDEGLAGAVTVGEDGVGRLLDNENCSSSWRASSSMSSSSFLRCSHSFCCCASSACNKKASICWRKSALVDTGRGEEKTQEEWHHLAEVEHCSTGRGYAVEKEGLEAGEASQRCSRGPAAFAAPIRAERRTTCKRG